MRDFQECQAFVEHLRKEHDQLHQTVSAVKRDLDAAEPRRLSEGLLRLRQQLVEHFAQEERGGCLEEAVSYAPHLSTPVAEIEHEHASILMLLDQLIKRSENCGRADFRESFQLFVTVVQDHESAENRILQNAFGTGEFDTNDPPSIYGGSR